ncbi:MAG TPA: SOS response-associated peptidase [Zoogloea sp.]|nr:SOS response-associated peptidase [Zoogloea sp.]
MREQLLLAECPEYGERYNIAPQSNILVVRFKPTVGRVGQLVKWGLIPAWAQDPSIGHKLNNARGETVAEKPAFRSSFARHRCLIPANGFYEWAAITENGKIRKQPYYAHPAEPDGLFAFAGLLAAWQSPAGETIVSTCIITTGANAVMAPIHDRMPVILQPGHYDAWLDPSNQDVAALRAMLAPCRPDLMRAYPVTPAINSGRTEGTQCIEPVEVR